MQRHVWAKRGSAVAPPSRVRKGAEHWSECWSESAADPQGRRDVRPERGPGRRRESGCRLAKHPPYYSPPHTLRSLLSGKCRVARGVQTKLPFHGKPLEAHCEAVGPFEQRRRRSGREKSRPPPLPLPHHHPSHSSSFCPHCGIFEGWKTKAQRAK